MGAITGGISLSQASDLQERCANNVCDGADADAIDEMNTLANVSNVSFAVAGAGVIVAAVGIILSDWSTEQHGHLQLVVEPGGLGLRGQF